MDHLEIHIIITNHLYCQRRQRSSEIKILTTIDDEFNGTLIDSPSCAAEMLILMM